MKIFLLLSLLEPSAFSSNTKTEDPTPKVVWTAECELKNKKIQIEAKSVKGEKTSEDMKVVLQSDSTEVEVPLSEAQLTLVSPTNKKFGVCSETAGIVVDKTKLLVLIGADSGKPEIDHLNALLIDTENLKILDSKEMLGDYIDSGKNKIFLKKISGGLSALIPQGFKKNSRNETPENFFMGWLNITVVEDKITSQWEMDLPPAHKPYVSNALTDSP